MTVYDSLNGPQREAVFQTEGPVLILAGAGSGKTRALTHRIAYLIREQGVNPWNILAITFTNKAAAEMRERVDSLIGEGADKIWVSTFHSTCVKILRRFIDRLGYDSNFSIYDTDDQKTLIHQVQKKLELDNKLYKDKMLLNTISSAKNELVGVEQFDTESIGDFRRSKIAEAYREYQEQLQKNNAVDFDDLIMLTVKLLNEHPDVREYWQERFKYIHVDEYQDTNTAQFRLVELLAGKYRNLCVVGDDDQSIYKFRGANIMNILNFEESYPGAKVVRLEQNYRSTKPILDAANAVIANNVGRKSKALWTQKDGGQNLKFRQFDTAQDEADAIVREIEADCLEHDIPYNECAVLFRTNAQSRVLEERFMRVNVPYRLFGGVNFYQRKEIKDILAYLKTIDNGRDDLAAQRIINIPKRGIGAASISKVINFAEFEGMSFFEALENLDGISSLGRAAKKMEDFVEQINVYRTKQKLFTVKELIEDILETTGYRKELEAEESVEAQTRIENIEEFVSKAAEFDQSHEAGNLTAFLEEVSLVADIDNMEDDDNRVRLMTLHAAKGLEFTKVILAGMEDGLFPSSMSVNSDDPTDLEEERRLCYVGITRAKEYLTLTSARQRMINGETKFSIVSRFVKEIPPLLVDEQEERSVFSRGGSRFVDRQSDFGRRDNAYGAYAYGGRTPDRVGGHSAYTDGGGYGSYGFEESDRDSLFELQGGKPKDKTSRTSTFGAGASQSGFGSAGYGSGSSRYGSSRAGASSRYGTASGSPAITRGASRVAACKAPDYKEGDRVRHVKFGDGKVIALMKGKTDYEVTVDFDKCGVKKMFASFARLVKL